MIHPEEIRLLIQQGRVPEGGRVIRGSVILAVRNIWLNCIGYLLINFLLASTFFWIKSFYTPTGFDIRFASIYVSMQILLGIIFSCIVMRTVPKAALVFLPEGFLCYSNITKRARPYDQTVQTFWYDSIVDLRLHISLWTETYVEIYFQNGETKKWYPKHYFGRSDEILQNILTAYVAYDIFHLSQTDEFAPESTQTLLVSHE